jgi:hypothetical protein
MKNLQILIDLNRRGEWGVENAIVINPAKARQFVSRDPE